MLFKISVASVIMFMILDFKYLQLIYWYRDTYNNRDISNDDYCWTKFSISPITTMDPATHVDS